MESMLNTEDAEQLAVPAECEWGDLRRMQMQRLSTVTAAHNYRAAFHILRKLNELSRNCLHLLFASVCLWETRGLHFHIALPWLSLLAFVSNLSLPSARRCQVSASVLYMERQEQSLLMNIWVIRVVTQYQDYIKHLFFPIHAPMCSCLII